MAILYFLAEEPIQNDQEQDCCLIVESILLTWLMTNGYGTSAGAALTAEVAAELFTSFRTPLYGAPKAMQPRAAKNCVKES